MLVLGSSPDFEVIHADPHLPRSLGPSNTLDYEASVVHIVEWITPELEEMKRKGEELRIGAEVTCGKEAPFHLRGSLVRVGDEGTEVWVLRLFNKQEREHVLASIRIATKFRTLARHYRLVAHDLKQPIGLIRIYSQLLRDTLPAQPPDATKDEPSPLNHLAVIDEATKDLAESLELLLSEVTDGTTGASDFVVNAEIERAVQFAHRQATVEQFAIEARLPTGRLMLHGNPDQFRQLVNNLVVNALEAMRPEDTLRLSAERDDDDLLLVVADTGPGMDDETARRCFDLHFTTKAAGHGVGLNGVQQIVQRMGGKLTLDTAPGEGCTFTVRLPLVK